MKKILFAFSMLVMAVPSYSFANEGAALPAAEEMNEAVVEDPAAPHRPRWGYACVATNLRRQRFLGRGWNLGRARQAALYSCQRRSFFRCWVQSCHRTRW